MANANDFLTKAHVQYLVQYLLYGAEPSENFVSNMPIKERLDKAESELTDKIREILKDEKGESKEFEQIMDRLLTHTNATFEAGLLSGIRLACTVWMETDLK